MAKRSSNSLTVGTLGFSLVELMVALVFTGLLMTGMAKVFQSSLSTFYTSGEILSSARRNRASIDLLYDDLNAADMYLTDLSAPPREVSATNPAFYVVPNQMVVGAGPDDPGSLARPYSADELYFYMDQPLAFEGTLTAPGNNAASILNTETSTGTGATTSIADNTFTVDCGDPVYAKLLEKTVNAAAAKTPPSGLTMVLKDQWKTVYFTSAPISGSPAQNVTIAGGGNVSSGITGSGDPGTPSGPHILGSTVMFYKPSQMVRYSIKMKMLDPQNPAGIPCLVRDQGVYSAAGFVADNAQESIITENVAGFKAYLSVNSGQTWAGLDTATNTPKTYAGFNTGWTSGIRADLDTQLAAAGRADFQTTQGNEHWFRKIPTLVRLDITTRTATKRTEYAATPTTAAYRELVQSFVIVPRHFGLPLN